MFFVPGDPKTKGSTVSFLDKRSGKVRTKSDCKDLKAWQRVVALSARAAGLTPELGRVSLGLEFILRRPQKDWTTGADSGRLRPSADRDPTVRPDLDKLTRAVLDGLEGVAYRNDSQVCGFSHLVKRYQCEPDDLPGVMISVVLAA